MGFGLGFYGAGYPYYGYPYVSYPYSYYYPAYDPYYYYDFYPYYPVSTRYPYPAPVLPAAIYPDETVSTARDTSVVAIRSEPEPVIGGRGLVIPRLLLPSREAPEALPERAEEPPPPETETSPHSHAQSKRRQP